MKYVLHYCDFMAVFVLRSPYLSTRCCCAYLRYVTYVSVSLPQVFHLYGHPTKKPNISGKTYLPFFRGHTEIAICTDAVIGCCAS